MRTLNYDQYKNKRSELLSLPARLDTKRAPARRKRDEKERELLLQLNRARWKKWLSSVKLRRISIRHYEFSRLK